MTTFFQWLVVLASGYQVPEALLNNNQLIDKNLFKIWTIWYDSSKKDDNLWTTPAIPHGTMQNLFGIWWNKQAAREYAAKHPEEQNTDNERAWN